MLKSLLVGIDGSEYSRSAVELGIAWSKQFDALLVGLGVIDQPGICHPEPVPLGAGVFKSMLDENRLKTATRQVEQALESFSIRCAEAGVPSKPLEDVGEPAAIFAKEAQRYDLILLGQRTYFRLEGSDIETLEQLLKAPPRPVVCVPPELGEGTAAVIAYDGSLQAARALNAYCTSGLASLASAVHVVTIDGNKTEGHRKAARAIDYLSFHEIRAQTHVVSSVSDPASTLMRQFQDLGAGLAIMGCYGKSAIREFFLGSVTRSLIENSKVPLFLYQ